MQVTIQADLEKKIIKLINDFRQENGDKGPISGRLTSKKLLVKTTASPPDLDSVFLYSCSFCWQDLYTALQKFNFKREHIEEAMKSSVLYGGDLHSALDWLCLNLKDGIRKSVFPNISKRRKFDRILFVTEELPDGFSQQMQEEIQKSRPRFQPPARQKPAAQSPRVPNTTSKETTKVSVYTHFV